MAADWGGRGDTGTDTGAGTRTYHTLFLRPSVTVPSCFFVGGFLVGFLLVSGFWSLFQDLAGWPPVSGQRGTRERKRGRGRGCVGLLRCLFALLPCSIFWSALGKSDQQSNNAHHRKTRVPPDAPAARGNQLTPPVQSALHFCTALSHLAGPPSPNQLPKPPPPPPNPAGPPSRPGPFLISCLGRPAARLFGPAETAAETMHALAFVWQTTWAGQSNTQCPA